MNFFNQLRFMYKNKCFLRNSVNEICGVRREYRYFLKNYYFYRFLKAFEEFQVAMATVTLR